MKMEFEQIVDENLKKYGWWANYAYHFTDVTNAVSILQSERLYSRINASEFMKNDNASSHVLDFTKYSTMSYVRFYFRPLTPTQYYNEGYKHFQLRYDNDLNANITVPIFFVFNLKNLLKNSSIKFSNFSQAGDGSQLFQGIDDFATKMEFDKIYSDGATQDPVRKYRHAEILYPTEYNICDSLEFVICRNEVEKNTLLNLLLSSAPRMYYKYKDKIRISKEKMYEYNGLFLENISFDKNMFSATFAQTYAKKRYDEKMMAKNNMQKLEPVTVLVNLEWKNNSSVLMEKQLKYIIDYLQPPRIVCKNLPNTKNAKEITVSIYTDGKLSGIAKFRLEDTEILK